MLKVKPDSLSTPEFMEEDEEQTQTPTSPFWIQTTTNFSSLIFNSFVLIIFLLLLALISMIFIIPSLIHSSSNIFKPSLVKRSWDSINLILVLVALIFGFLSRNISNDEKQNFDASESSAGAPIMYDPQDQSMNPATGLRRQRTSISYPDLRELSLPDDPWRFSDDTHLNYYRVLESNRNSLRQRSRREYNSAIQDVFNPNLYSTPPQPPPPSQSPANSVKHRIKQSKTLSPETESPEKKGGKSEKKRGDVELRRARSSEPRKILSLVIDPLPEPTSPPPISPLTERKLNDGNATPDFFTSFYHKKKKRRQRDRSVDNLGSLLHDSQPPAVKFQLPPPPPPPPPARAPKLAPRATVTRVAPFVTDRPGAPFMMTSFNGIEDSSSGGESPMKRIPPPPPLPPFKMPDWKFAVEGDYVRLQSTLSSPDGDEARSPSSDVDTAAAAAMAVFYPSSDVDTKADSFIARFRAGLKLERMSKLGPGPGPSDS